MVALIPAVCELGVGEKDFQTDHNVKPGLKKRSRSADYIHQKSF